MLKTKRPFHNSLSTLRILVWIYVQINMWPLLNKISGIFRDSFFNNEFETTSALVD